MASNDSLYLKSATPADMSNEDLLAHALLNLGSIGLGAAFGGAQGGQLGAQVGSKMTSDYLETQKAAKALAAEKASKAEEKKSEREFQKELAQMKMAGEKDIAVARLSKEHTRPIAATEASKIAAHDSALNFLEDLDKTVAANKDIIGPVSGTISKINPWDTRGRTVNTSFKLTTQNIGKALEEGKLAEGDIHRYLEMLPSIQDSPDVAQQKIQLVKRLIGQERNNILNNMEASGSDVGRFAKTNINTPDVMKQENAPNSTTGKVIQSLFGGPTATAAQPHPQDDAAFAWAKKNPKDPRAIAILQRFGMGE